MTATLTEQSTLTKRQRRTLGPKVYTENGQTMRIKAEIRFDDDCGNGHNSFSITGSTEYKNGNGQWGEGSAGCIHDDIARHFPEIAKYIKWHLMSTDGPMHYVANASYHASDRDYNELRKGEPNPRSVETQIQFGENPIKHKYGRAFMEFLKAAAPALNASGPSFDFEVIAYHHENRKGETFDFKPKYTFGGFATRWHECPFDTEAEALDFLWALQNCNPRLIDTITAWGEGKTRDFDAARHCAVWPEATEEELSAENLKEVLAARLPKLLAEFRADMEELGFVW